MLTLHKERWDMLVNDELGMGLFIALVSATVLQMLF